MKYTIVLILTLLPAAHAQSPCEGLPPGKHSLLERFTADFGLSCAQQLQIEPLLHAEESVSKPLLAFAAFSAEERAGVMLKIKLAARRQIRGLLQPDQQKKMDAEIESTRTAGSKGGGKKKEPPKVDAFANEEALIGAIMNYAALTPDEKKSLVLQVKKAAVRDGALPLAPEQKQKIDADLRELEK